MEQKIPSSDEEVVIKDAIKEYLIDCQIRNLRPRTLEWYSDRLEAILEPYWNGGQVERLMVSLGHTSITMSLHYARLADVDALADAMEFSPIAHLKDTQGRGGAKRRNSREQEPETRTGGRKRHR